ncbi:MBL fold metallo-hydrolase [Limnobacter sp.]|uniref:MBL fold metallo-hydrolase n=1 Tax=Limnobacter sp. TaxID=2003368 RepID=UPI00351578F3
MRLITSVRLWVALLAMLGMALGGLLYLANSRPDIQPHTHATLTTASKASVRSLFLGTSTLVWTDGKTTWLVDGFLSRQPLWNVAFTPLDVDEALVDATLQHALDQLNMPHRVAGIVVAHSHYDHAMDAPYIAKRYGGQVHGSESTWQIALGQDLPPTQMEVVHNAGVARLGDFEVKIRQTRHAPTGFTGGLNHQPLRLPAHALRFKEGLSYSFVVHHKSQGDEPIALVQPSAGFLPGENRDLKVPVVFLGVGGLGRLGQDYIESYWQEMVTQTGARRVYLIHWDDFTKPVFSQGQPAPLVPMPALMDDMSAALPVLQGLALRDGVQLEVHQAWETITFN